MKTKAVQSTVDLLKKIAEAWGSTVILLTQVPSKPKRYYPTLYDIKEYMEVESDLVLLLHREYLHLKSNPVSSESKQYQKYLTDLEREEHRAEIFVARNKYGPAGKTIEIRFYDEHIGFVPTELIACQN